MWTTNGLMTQCILVLDRQIRARHCYNPCEKSAVYGMNYRMITAQPSASTYGICQGYILELGDCLGGLLSILPCLFLVGPRTMPPCLDLTNYGVSLLSRPCCDGQCFSTVRAEKTFPFSGS